MFVFVWPSGPYVLATASDFRCVALAIMSHDNVYLLAAVRARPKYLGNVNLIDLAF